MGCAKDKKQYYAILDALYKFNESALTVKGTSRSNTEIIIEDDTVDTSKGNDDYEEQDSDESEES